MGDSRLGQIRFVGSGALNLDFFYEVPDLGELVFPGVKFVPGGEVAGDRHTLYALRDYLEAQGLFLTSGGGGSSANTIWALARFGFETAFMGAVGADEEGDLVLDELAETGVDLSKVCVSGSTGIALIILDKDRDRFIFVAPGSAELRLAEHDPPLSDREWLHLSSLVTEEGLTFHRRLVRRSSGPVSLDPGEIYVSRGPGALDPLLERTTYLFLTETEVETLGLSAEELFDKGIEALFLKRGARGAKLFLPGGSFEFPVESPSRIVDNTGAGDFFDAGVLAALALGLAPVKAVKLGLKVAAMSLRDYGRRGCPDQKEFLLLLKEVRDSG